MPAVAARIRMPFCLALCLLLLLAWTGVPGAARAQDAAPADAPAPAQDEAPAAPSAAAREAAWPPLSGTPLLYSPDALVDMPYVYPLVRMRLTPEMRQAMP